MKPRKAVCLAAAVLVIMMVLVPARAQELSKEVLFPPLESLNDSSAITAGGVRLTTNSLGQFTLQRAADLRWLLYPNPSTTYLAVKIDGTVVTNRAGGGLTVVSQSGSTFTYAPILNVRITEVLVVEGDALKIEVRADNLDSQSHAVQSRILFDTQVDDNDGAPIYGGDQHYTYEAQFVPPLFDEWRSWRRPDDQTVVGVGTLETAYTMKLVFAHWTRAFSATWDYGANPAERFYTPGYTQSPQSDSATLVYMDHGGVGPQTQVTRATWYGIGRGVPGTTDRDTVCQAFTKLGRAVEDYQEGAIDVVSSADVTFARNIAKDADLKQTAWEFTQDLIAGGTPAKIIGKMAHNSAGKTAQYIEKHMFKKLALKVARSGERFIATHAIDWTDPATGIDWHWSDPQITSYLDTYFHGPDRLGPILEQSTAIPREMCLELPADLPPGFPTSAVVRELGRVESEVRRLKPAAGRAREQDVYWALPGMCSIQLFGNLNPVLLGVSSYAAEDLKSVGTGLRAVETVTTVRRDICMSWVVGGGVVKILSALTVAGALPGEAIYWTGVSTCSALGTANTVADFAKDGWSFWRQYEDVNSLHSDVLMTTDFLKTTGAALQDAAEGNTGCSTAVAPGTLSIPDVTSGWFEGYATATGTLPINNGGTTQGLARTRLNIYKENGGTYSELVLATGNSNGDRLVEPGQSSTATFEFEVPAGNLLFTDRYYAEARVVGSAGSAVRSTFFRACYPTSCFLEDVWNEIMTGLLSAGESQEDDVVADPDAAQAEFLLSYRGSDFDLHIYDSLGRHVGFNYDTGRVEFGIPGAAYSGTSSYPEVIRIPLSGNRHFRVRVIAVNATGAEDFSVILTNLRDHAATLVAMPERVETGAAAGATAAWTVVLGETGRQHDAVGARVSISDLVGSAGTIPSRAVTVVDPPTVIAAGTQANVSFMTVLESGAYGFYDGSISVTFAGRTTAIPVRIFVSNSAPVANAGIDQVLECSSAGGGTAVLDGSLSSDPDSTPGTNDDITSYFWQEGAQTLATVPIATVPFSLGAHEVRLTVIDKGGLSGVDDVSITVRDTKAPLGGITTPSDGKCVGPAEVPVVVRDSFADVCDPNIVRSYDPPAGPAYGQHGNFNVTLTAADSSGNAASSKTSFTIDLLPPQVMFLVKPSQWVFPSFVPFNKLFADSDDDGAVGGEVHETVSVDGCTVYDGLTYGNGDGLLLDEKIPAAEDEMCRLVRLCGKREWHDPVIAVTATDCGGNSATATMVKPGGFHVAASRCP